MEGSVIRFLRNQQPASSSITLEIGDKITLTTKLGTRTYEVTSVSKVSETDRSAMTPTGEDRIVLYTCVMNQSAYRWCVQATAV